MKHFRHTVMALSSSRNTTLSRERVRPRMRATLELGKKARTTNNERIMGYTQVEGQQRSHRSGALCRRTASFTRERIERSSAAVLLPAAFVAMPVIKAVECARGISSLPPRLPDPLQGVNRQGLRADVHGRHGAVHPPHDGGGDYDDKNDGTQDD